ncbi:5363_t:CDS:1, partial [Ambispora leptoticha]
RFSLILEGRFAVRSTVISSSATVEVWVPVVEPIESCEAMEKSNVKAGLR